MLVVSASLRLSDLSVSLHLFLSSHHAQGTAHFAPAPRHVGVLDQGRQTFRDTGLSRVFAAFRVRRDETGNDGEVPTEPVEDLVRNAALHGRVIREGRVGDVGERGVYSWPIPDDRNGPADHTEGAAAARIVVVKVAGADAEGGTDEKGRPAAFARCRGGLGVRRDAGAEEELLA